MEKVLAKYGTEEQKKEWLQPLLEGAIRSAFVMTERHVVSSNAKNISLDMRRDGNTYVLNGSVRSSCCFHQNSLVDPNIEMVDQQCR